MTRVIIKQQTGNQGNALGKCRSKIIVPMGIARKLCLMLSHFNNGDLYDLTCGETAKLNLEGLSSSF